MQILTEVLKVSKHYLYTVADSRQFVNLFVVTVTSLSTMVQIGLDVTYKQSVVHFLSQIWTIRQQYGVSR